MRRGRARRPEDDDRRESKFVVGIIVVALAIAAAVTWLT